MGVARHHLPNVTPGPPANNRSQANSPNANWTPVPPVPVPGGFTPKYGIRAAQAYDDIVADYWKEKKRADKIMRIYLISMMILAMGVTTAAYLLQRAG